MKQRTHTNTQVALIYVQAQPFAY